jgi:branched-chain amino acid aminotransferase
MLSSTPCCLLPVTQLDGQPIADGRGGPVYRQLLETWSRHVGLDIAAQAQRFVKRDGKASQN